MEFQLADDVAGFIKDKASSEAALGSHAIGIGDTLSAQQHYSEAGRILEGESAGARDSSKRALLRFLAASQYFHGGDYKRAQKLSRQIEERLLPANVKHLFQAFTRDVETRSDHKYAQTMREKLQLLTTQGKFPEALDLLKSHTYILGRTQLSTARASLRRIETISSGSHLSRKGNQIRARKPETPLSVRGASSVAAVGREAR